MRSLSFVYFRALLLCLFLYGVAGCSQKEREDAAENTKNAVQKAYDKTTGVLKDVAEGINDAVYK